MTPLSGKKTRSGKITHEVPLQKHQPARNQRNLGGDLNEKGMTLNIIKRQKRELYYQKVHAEKEIQHKDSVPSIRSNAAKVQWNMRLHDTANDPANESDSNGPESESAPLESDEDTQLDDTQLRNIQDSKSDLTAIDTTPLSKKQKYWTRCHFLSHLPTSVYDSLKVFRWCYIRLGKDINLVDNLKDMNIE